MHVLTLPTICRTLLLCAGLTAQTAPFVLTTATVPADTIRVTNTAELRAALRGLAPGSQLQLAAGEYGGGHYLENVTDVTIAAADPNNPPRFTGGSSAWHFSRCSGLTLRNLHISGQRSNGINLDDGGRRESVTQRITLEHLQISDIGPRGNVDAIKCSGLDELQIRHCQLHGWGGQGIDLVGCHRVQITDCRLRGKDGFTQSAGIQCKGGSSDVLIERCEFQDAGERPINAGGSTGLEFFRPADAPYEAHRIRIRRNTISGSLCACAFVGVDEAEFTENTVLFPRRWIFRILQETTAERFVPCRRITVADNAIVFRRSEISADVNIGGGTAPETTVWKGNTWFAEDRPERSRPQLPTPETAGRYGIDPRTQR